MTLKTCAVVCAAALLAACGAANTRQTHENGAVAPMSMRPPAGVAAYRIDSAQSELRLLVYSAGPMARLGHNHVIVNRAVSGWVDAAGTAGGSFSLQVPVADFVVDDAQARAAEAPDFSQEVTEDARAGTRHNMLGPALLDAVRFPTITISSIAVTPAAEGQGPDTEAPSRLVATLAIQVAGHASRLTVPFKLETAAGRISASGTAVLRQSEMGLTPFSVMLGALQVQDELTVKFKLVAVKG
jgi:polyisoprenoid-binding protein YceI